jgi:4'-phosphopantetheinyl transferase
VAWKDDTVNGVDRSVLISLIGSDVSDTTLAELTALLDDAEQYHADAIVHPVDRRRYIVAHGATRQIVGRQLGIPPADLRWLRGPNGKPRLAGISAHVNLSHSDDLALIAMTTCGPVGVDVQRVHRRLDATALARRYYPAAEAGYVAAVPQAERPRRFVELWTRKEACLKASGARLMQGLQLPVQGSGDIVVRDQSGPLVGPYVVRDVRVPAGYRAAVAVEGSERYAVITQHWSP